MIEICAMEKKHQIEACSIKLSEINAAKPGPKANKKVPRYMYVNVNVNVQYFKYNQYIYIY